MNICICDDDVLLCQDLRKMIQSHGSHRITEFHSAEELLFECENQFPFDCIFLDIQMKEKNGIECARKIREYDKKVSIIFLSAIKDYVFEGYEVNAVRYLLKPINQAKCFEVLDLMESTLEKEHHYLYVNKTKIDCESILYIESYGHYCTIHGDKNVEIKSSLSELCGKLPDGFVQTHRSYVVNLAHIESILKDNCLLDDGSLIPISRSSLKKVNGAFMEYVKGHAMM